MNIIDRLDRTIAEGQFPSPGTKIRMQIAIADVKDALLGIQRVIESVEARCMAVDGPVTPTHQEITDSELRQIYRLAGGKIKK